MNLNEISDDSSFKDIDDSQNNENVKRCKRNEQQGNICLTEQEDECNILTEIDEETKAKKSMFPEYNFEKTHQTLTTTKSNNSMSRSKFAGSQGSPDSSQKSMRQKNYQEQTNLYIQINHNNKQQISQSAKSSPNNKYVQQNLEKYNNSPSDVQIHTDRQYQQQQQSQYNSAQTDRFGFSQEKYNQQKSQNLPISQFQLPQQISQKPQQTYITPQNSLSSTSNNLSSTQNYNSQQSPILNYSIPQNTIQYPSIQNINFQQSQSITTAFSKNSQLQKKDNPPLNMPKQPSIIFKNQNQGNNGFASNANLTQSIIDNFANGTKNLSQTIVPPVVVRGSNQTFGSNQNLDDMSATKVNFNKYQNLKSQNSLGGGNGNNYPTDMSQTIIFKQQVDKYQNDQIADTYIKSVEKLPSKDEIKYIKDIAQSQTHQQNNFAILQNQQTAEFLVQPTKSLTRDIKTREFNQESQFASSMGQTLNYKQLNQQYVDLQEDDDILSSQQSNKTYKPNQKNQFDQNAMSTTVIYKNQQQKQYQEQSEPYKIMPSFSNLCKKNNLTESIIGGQNPESSQISNQNYRNTNEEVILDSQEQIAEKNELLEENCQVSNNKIDQAEIFQPSKLAWSNMKSLTSRSDHRGLNQSQLKESSNQQTSYIGTGHFKTSQETNQIFESNIKLSKINYDQPSQMNPLSSQSKQISFGDSKIGEVTSQSSILKSKKLQLDPPLTARNHTTQLNSPKQLNPFFPMMTSGSVTILEQKRAQDLIVHQEEGTVITDKIQKINFLNQNNNTAESQDMDPKQQILQSQSPTNISSAKLIQQKINENIEFFVSIKDENDNNNSKGEKKKLFSFNKESSTSSQFQSSGRNKKQNSQFSGSSVNSSSSTGNQNQVRQNDNKIYEQLSVRIDPSRSLLDPKYYAAASQILHVSEISGLKNSVYVNNNLAQNIQNMYSEEPANKDKSKKAKGFQPIKNSDWIPYFKDKQNDVNEIRNSQENGGDQNYYTIMKKLELRGDEKNLAIFDKVKKILEEQNFTELDIIGRGSYGLVIKVKNPQGFERAIKAQLYNAEDKDIYKDGEFKIGKYLTDDGTENLYGQIITLHNIYILQDTDSPHRIYLMEMELAESSLSKQITKRLKDGVMVDPISEKEFEYICHWCIQSLVRIHNSGCVHRDIKPDNILKMGNNYIFTDFGESEYLYILKGQHIKEKDNLKVKQRFSGTEAFLSPLLRECLSKLSDDCDQVIHDPFKSDIYSLGLVFLQIKLFINGMNKTEVYAILKDPQRAYEEAKRNSINHIILKQQYFIMENQEFECINILSNMLEVQESKRMSTLKLALICQIDKQFLSRIQIPYPQIFRPKQIKEEFGNNICKINYSIKYMEYEGETIKVEDKILRHGRGKLFKQEKNSKSIIYDGAWSYDLPHGYGKLSKIYQDYDQGDWEYEGQFYKGVFHGQGVIKFNGHPVYSGVFRNYLLKEFLVLKQNFPPTGSFEFTQLPKWKKKTFKIKKQGDNQEICLQLKLHSIQNIENLICILKESKANFQRIKLQHFRKLNTDSQSHAPHVVVYKKKDVFVSGKSKCVEIIYDDEFTLNDKQLENILSFCNQIEYIDLKFVSQSQINFIFQNNHECFSNLKCIQNLDETKITEEVFCNFIKTSPAQKLEVIQYTNKNLFGLGLWRIFDQNSFKDVKEINFSKCNITAQKDSFMKLFQSEQLLQVQKLNFQSLKSLDDESLKILSQSPYLKNLKELDISQCTQVTHKGIQKFSENLSKNLPSLQHLKIGGIINPSQDKGFNKYFFIPTNKMIESLIKGIENLKTLDLSLSPMITDKVVKFISTTKHLQNLNLLILYKCQLLTNKSFEYFHRSTNNLQKLEMVDFSHLNITLELKKATKFLKKIKIIGCMNIDWNKLAKYLDITPNIQQIHFDSDILEFNSPTIKYNEEELINQAISKLSNKKIYLNITSESSLENITQFFEKDYNLDIRVFSEIYPEFQLERYIVKHFKKQDKSKKYKIKDIYGSSLKEKIQAAVNKTQKYKHYQILENPLTVLNQDYDEKENKTLPANEERFEDLKRILNGRLFLEFYLLDLKNEQQLTKQIIKPLAQSKFTKGLEIIDLSNSQINNDDLFELTKSSYFEKLEVLCINNCQEITEAGINLLIDTSHSFPKLKQIQIQSKLINFSDINCTGLKRRPHLKLIVDTLQINNSEISHNEKLFYQYATQICNHNQAIIKAISLLGTPLLIIKILNQLHQPQPSPLIYLTLDFSIDAESDVQDIMTSIQLVKKFTSIESLVFDFRKQHIEKKIFEGIDTKMNFQILINILNKIINVKIQQ